MRNFLIIPILFFGLILSTNAYSHCQIPCGIYDDEATFSKMFLDVETIKKSINGINSADTDKNNIVRWVMNKEDHANNIKETAAEYFLAQRIKEGTPKYQEKLESLHRIIVLSMKAKQKSDLEIANSLEAEIKNFKNLYFAKEEMKKEV